MNAFLEKLRTLVHKGDIRISEHGYDELAEDSLTAREIVIGIQDAVIVEEYPKYPKGPCALLLQRDLTGSPVHAVWGIPKGFNRPAVLVTAYRPDPDRWDTTYTRRLQK